MSNIESNIRPQVPATANMIDIVESAVSARPEFLASRPVCRSHLSAANDKSRNMVVTLV